MQATLDYSITKKRNMKISQTFASLLKKKYFILCKGYKSPDGVVVKTSG